MPGHHVGERRRIAAVADIGHLQPRALEKQRHSEVRQAAGAALGISELVLLCAHVRDELGDGLGRKALVHHQYECVDGDHADGCEILDRIHLRQRRVDGERRRRAPQQRISVGRRTGDRFGGDGAVSAEPVLDHEGLPERIGETLSDDPRHAVGIATSGVGRDDADRPLRPKLRLRVDATHCGGERRNRSTSCAKAWPCAPIAKPLFRARAADRRETVCMNSPKGSFFQIPGEDRLSGPQGVVMPHGPIRLRVFGPSLCISLCIAAALLVFDAPAANAGKIKMVFPGPVTTFSLPYLVAQKKGWLGDLEVEDVHVTGDANAMRVLLSGNADIGLIGTLNVLASINAGAYSLVLATGKGSKLADVAGKTFASSGPGGLPDQLPRLIMRKHGIDETTARFVQIGGHAARLQAVIGGRADATLVNTVTALKGVKDGKVTVVARLSAEFPGLGYVWNVVRTEALAKPELAAAFQTMTDIGIRGSRFIMANPDEAAVILHERLGDLELAFLTAVVRDLNGENVWGVNGGLDPAIEEFTADLNMKLGNLPVNKPPNLCNI